nr:MAG TPA: hypothetical protein [Caudoviricetes sp.]
MDSCITSISITCIYINTCFITSLFSIIIYINRIIIIIILSAHPNMFMPCIITIFSSKCYTFIS